MLANNASASRAVSANSVRCPRCRHGLLVGLNVTPDPSSHQWFQCNRCAQVIVRSQPAEDADPDAA